MTEVVIVGLVALPLALGTVFVFPRLLDGLFGMIPYKVNERAATLILVGYAWGVLLLSFRRSSESVHFSRAIVEAFVAGLFSALVTGAGIYVVNSLWQTIPYLVN